MAESKVNRLIVSRKLVHSSEGATGDYSANLSWLSEGSVPPGYRLVSYTWFVDEDAPVNVLHLGAQLGRPDTTNMVTSLLVRYRVNTLPAMITYQLILERSDEPDVPINLGSEIIN